MKHANFHTRFTGATFLLGGVMVALGFLIRPVAIRQNFQLENFLDISKAVTIWIRSFQILVFGLFIRLAGLVALGTLHRGTSRWVLQSSWESKKTQRAKPCLTSREQERIRRRGYELPSFSHCYADCGCHYFARLLTKASRPPGCASQSQ
jgi:hypothetical protein